MKTQMRRFYLERAEDASGVSGTGIVAEGVVFTTGYVALTWLTHLQCNSFYHSVDVMLKIHGHHGRTRIVYIDPDIDSDESSQEAP
jgi:hypothetical protein